MLQYREQLEQEKGNEFAIHQSSFPLISLWPSRITVNLTSTTANIVIPQFQSNIIKQKQLIVNIHTLLITLLACSTIQNIYINSEIQIC